MNGSIELAELGTAGKLTMNNQIHNNHIPKKIDTKITPKIIPLIFCCGGSLFTAISYIFIKLGHNKMSRSNIPPPSNCCKLMFDPMFAISIVCIAIGSASNTLALAFGN